ncbi:MAG: HlyD family efflux transporter periplasmic adaptor subunit, partial [Bacteroidales bacterium]|nr:HlyD family efflux transporter periplasmic adaptor subunit [Bacteroidales bacterium]
QKAFRDYSHYLETDQIAVRKGLLRQQIEGQRSHHATLMRQKTLLDSEVEMERKTLERDSLLYARKAISQAEYETSRKGFLSKLNTVAGFEASLEATALGILQLEQQLVELDLQRVTETESHESQIYQQIYQLKAQVATWLDTYAIIAPSDGIVSLQDYWSPGQHVNVGDVIANITPEDPSEVTGRMKVSSVGFGKVAIGQTVNVRLNGFPYMEYGILKGVVANVASVPERLQDGSVAYTVAVDFPDGLESTYHKEFPLIQQMDGEAQIITRDRRLIEQFIDPIVSLFRNR